MTPTQLTKLLAHAFRHRRKILVKGEPGIGKSDIIESAVERAEADLVMMHPAVSDPTDFKGMPALVTEGTAGDSAADSEGMSASPIHLAEFLPFGDLRKLLEASSLTVCFMDDIGQAPHAVQAALMQLIQARCINGHKISDHVVFCGATNDSDQMAGVSSLLEPVKSRFDSIVELKASIKDWKKWALGKGNMPPALIAFLELRPDLLSAFKATTALTNSPTPRTAAAVGKWINQGVTDYEVIAGSAGEEFAAELIGFLKIYQSMPDIDEITNRPDSARLPDSPACHFAVCSALTHYANRTNFPAFHTYIKRCGKEWELRTMRSIIVKHKKLAETPTFIQWASDNAAALA